MSTTEKTAHIDTITKDFMVVSGTLKGNLHAEWFTKRDDLGKILHDDKGESKIQGIRPFEFYKSQNLENDLDDLQFYILALTDAVRARSPYENNINIESKENHQDLIEEFAMYGAVVRNAMNALKSIEQKLEFNMSFVIEKLDCLKA